MFQIIILLVLCMQTSSAATSGQAYPSEYVYHKDSVTRSEPDSANCRRYPAGVASEHSDIFSEDYIHCNGTQLRLSDSELGQQSQYNSSYHYEWSAESQIRHLLFIFPRRVNLTTITLHYYANSRRGLPPLRLYAAPDDFNVWETLGGGISFVDVAAVPSGEELAGRRNITINVNFNTKKLQVVIAARTYEFATSEVEFYQAYPGNSQTSPSSTISPITTSLETQAENTPIKSSASQVTTTDLQMDSATRYETAAASTTDTVVSPDSASNGVYLAVAGIVIAIALLLTAVIIIVIVILAKNTAKQKMEHDDAYCTLSRSGPAQHRVLNDTSDTYDQIKLSPLTGQAEFVSNEPENTRNISQHQHHIHHTDPNTASCRSVHILQYQQHAQTEPETASLPNSQQDDKPSSKLEQPTYAVVNKKLKKKATRKKPDSNENTEGIDGEFDAVQKKEDITEKEITGAIMATQEKPVEELYAAVIKKAKAKKSDTPPPIPAHTVEELYTAVNKIPKVSAATKEEEEAPPIPPHTVEELYTAVNKTPKGNAADNEEEAPPIPPYTAGDM